MIDYADMLSNIALEIKAIMLRPDNPFIWASGYYMPIYNDNRMLLGNANHRRFVAEGFKEIIKSNQIHYDVIAGTSTSGIPPATTLADLLNCPLIYVRSKKKDHGLQNQIEGILLQGQEVIVIEDLISTGGSSIKAIKAVRDAGGVVENCLSIFNYGFHEAEVQFKRNKCDLVSILTYETLLQNAIENDYINEKQMELLKEWRNDPFKWGAKHGFPNMMK